MINEIIKVLFNIENAAIFDYISRNGIRNPTHLKNTHRRIYRLAQKRELLDELFSD